MSLALLRSLVSLGMLRLQLKPVCPMGCCDVLGGDGVGVREVLELTCPGIPHNKGSEELGRQPMSSSEPCDSGCIPSTLLEMFSSPRPARRPTTSSSCRIVS